MFQMESNWEMVKMEIQTINSPNKILWSQINQPPDYQQ